MRRKILQRLWWYSMNNIFIKSWMLFLSG
jgi:hypothetical protein